MTELKPWTLHPKLVPMCASCGGARHPMGGTRCKGCYDDPAKRKQSRFPTYKTELVSRPATRVTPLKIERAMEETHVPVNLYVKPDYPDPYKLRSALLFEQRQDAAALKRATRLELRKPKIVAAKAPLLAYPYIAVKRDEHADLLAVNSLVPASMPGREDVCQEIMLALWERRITLDQLKANRADLRAFVRSFTRDNYEAGGYAISLDVPMRSGQSWHDVLADPATELSR